MSNITYEERGRAGLVKVDQYTAVLVFPILLVSANIYLKLLEVEDNQELPHISNRARIMATLDLKTAKLTYLPNGVIR